MTPNPYGSPRSEIGVELASPASLGELVKGWEKLRLLYNAVLLLPGIGVLAVAVSRSAVASPTAVATGLLCGLAANAAFFCGPLAELYLRAMFFRGEKKTGLRWTLLVLGFLVSFGVMGLFLIGIFLEPFVLPTPD